MKTKEEIEREFNEKFELEYTGCSECGGSELIDKTEVRYPKGEYHCEYDLDKVKHFISKNRQADVDSLIEWVKEKWAEGIFDESKKDTDLGCNYIINYLTQLKENI